VVSSGSKDNTKDVVVIVLGVFKTLQDDGGNSISTYSELVSSFKAIGEMVHSRQYPSASASQVLQALGVLDKK
jgi:hypothetical protein